MSYCPRLKGKTGELQREPVRAGKLENVTRAPSGGWCPGCFPRVAELGCWVWCLPWSQLLVVAETAIAAVALLLSQG